MFIDTAHVHVIDIAKELNWKNIYIIVAIIVVLAVILIVWT